MSSCAVVSRKEAEALSSPLVLSKRFDSRLDPNCTRLEASFFSVTTRSAEHQSLLKPSPASARRAAELLELLNC